MKEKFKFQATASAGLESLVARELRQLGLAAVRIDDRSRVFFEGNQEAMATANLWLRTADRIKIVVGEFKARSFEALFEGVLALDWENYLPLGCSFPVAKSKSVKSQLHNEPSVQSITKKAIVKKLQQVYHRPETQPLPENGATFSIEIALYKDVATLMIDTTGEALFKRGYRKEHGGAPIKETMAAAVIMMTNWLANPSRPFVDPTCGSGTFCIEAAMLAMNRAPGLKRHFAFESWPWVNPSALTKLRSDAEKVIQWPDSSVFDDEVSLSDHKNSGGLDIRGFDVDGQTIEVARNNTLALGLENVVKYKQMRLQDFRSQQLDGVLVSNPPYGERLGDEESVKALYHDMGEVFSPLTAWSKYILTSDLQFEEAYGAKATKKRKLYNGRLRIDLYSYFGQRIN